MTTLNSWNVYDMGGAPPLPCTVCRREIAEHEMYYTPSHLDDWQEDCIRQLFHVDAYSDFLVCEQCTGFQDFDDWLENRWNHSNLVEQYGRTHDWLREGF
jgi:hypothetical protein